MDDDDLGWIIGDALAQNGSRAFWVITALVCLAVLWVVS